jgi:holin-like protein
LGHSRTGDRAAPAGPLAGHDAKPAQGCEPLANTLLGHLSLLFVPAAVGLIQHLGVFAEDFWPLILALSFSTLLTLIVTATVFVLVDRWVGTDAPADEVH